MLVRDKGGYLYPWSEQASTVLDVLRMEVERSGGKVEISTEVKGITQNGGGRFTILTLEGEKKKLTMQSFWHAAGVPLLRQGRTVVDLCWQNR